MGLKRNTSEAKDVILADGTKMITNSCVTIEFMIEAQETSGEERVLFCDKCGAQHIDEGWYGKNPHYHHLCEHCNKKFSIGAKTIGVAEPALVDVCFKNVNFYVLEVSC